MDRAQRAGMSFAVAAVALLVSARAGSQTSEQAAATQGDFLESRSGTRAALLAAGDADSLEAAALLTSKTRGAERLQLVLRAAAAAPARPDLEWLALAFCIQAEACDVTPLEARLRAADPGNGAAWMGTLERAAVGTPQWSAGVAGVSGAERFDIYWNPLIVHTTEAIQRTKTMEDQEALVLAIGVGAAQAIPALQRLSHACTDATIARPEDLGSCRKLVGVLRHGDTSLIEGLGLSLTQRLWPAASDEYREATAARRVLHYRLSKAAEAMPGIVSDEGAKRYLELLAAHRTEEEALVANLVELGINPDPPAGRTEPALRTR